MSMKCHNVKYKSKTNIYDCKVLNYLMFKKYQIPQLMLHFSSPEHVALAY